MKIAERIKNRRKELGLTQKQLGELCGMADSAIRKYESGKIVTKQQTLCKIACALNVPEYYFTKPEPPTVVAKQFVKYLDTNKVYLSVRFKGFGGDWSFSQEIPNDIFEKNFEVWRF